MRGYSSLPCCTGLSLQWLLFWQRTGSRHMGFSSCSTSAWQLQYAALGCSGFKNCSSWALECRLRAMVHRLSCFASCGIFSDQGSNCIARVGSGFFTTEAPQKPDANSFFFFPQMPTLESAIWDFFFPNSVYSLNLWVPAFEYLWACLFASTYRKIPLCLMYFTLFSISIISPPRLPF